MKNSNRKTFFMFLMAFLVAFFIVSLVGVLRSSFTSSGAPEIPFAQAVPSLSDTAIKTPASFSDLAERVKPAVVNISTFFWRYAPPRIQAAQPGFRVHHQQ